MKRFIAVIAVMCLLVSTIGALDYYGFVFDEYDSGMVVEISGTVADVMPNTQVWIVVIYTACLIDRYYTAAPVALLYGERPRVTIGDVIDGEFIFNGTWREDYGALPTFREQ